MTDNPVIRYEIQVQDLPCTRQFREPASGKYRA